MTGVLTVLFILQIVLFKVLNIVVYNIHLYFIVKMSCRC